MVIAHILDIAALPENRLSRATRVSNTRCVRCVVIMFVIAAVLLALPSSTCRADSSEQSSAHLVVAANIYEPFVFMRDGKLAGFDVDLVNLIASLNGWSVSYETMTFPAELLSVQSGSVDLGIGSVFKTSDRAARFAFTTSYMNSGLILVTPADSTIHSAGDLGGHRIAVKTGTTSDDYVSGLGSRYGHIEIERYVSAEQVIAAVASGRADAAVHDYINAQYLINAHYLGTLVIQKGTILAPFLAGPQPVAYPAARNMLPLLPQFNTTLTELKRNGMLAQLERTWFGSTISVYAGSDWLRMAVPWIAGVSAVFLAAYFLVLRERAMRAARDRAAYYQQLFSAVPEPALLVRDTKERLEIEAVNAALCTLLGRQESELLGAPLGSLMVSAVGSMPMMIGSLEDQSNASMRWQFIASDGTTIPAEVMMSTLQTPAKRVLIVARDLREQLRAQETVQTAYEQYHALFDEAPDPTLIMTEGKVMLANLSTARVLGLTREELVGKAILDLSSVVQPDGQPSAQVLQEKEAGAVAGQVQRFDWVLVRSDGQQVICEASVKSIASAGPSVLQVIFRDVTDRRLMEERSQQLERELLQSQKMEAVGRLAGGIAHDFNNIMGGIMGHASLLKVDAVEGTDLYDGLSTIELAARRAASLTRRLLSFARKETLTVTNVDIGSVVTDTLAIAMPGFDQRTVLAQNIAPDLAYVAGDQTQLEEVFLNLIINARDAMKPKGGTLTIDAHNVNVDQSFCASHAIPALADGAYVEISVTDSGCGLTADVRDHLFEPFFTTKPDGTGLGLSIVWRVVHEQKGTIAVKSEPNKGTTFTVYLPAIPRAEAQQKARQTSISGSLPRSARGETVLIVDDEEVVRSVAVRVLSGLGYNVIDTSNPLDAVTIYKQSWHSIDLVLVDMMMPHMNGKELFERLREVNPEVLAILMSGYDATDTTLETSGFVGFIPKPYTLQELATRVYQSLMTPGSSSSGRTTDASA